MENPTQEDFIEHLVLGRQNGTIPKLYFSTWSILLNPNIRFRDVGGLAIKDFLVKIENIWESVIDQLQDFVVFLVPDTTWVRSNVKQVLASYRSEIAPKTTSPHIHGKITIKHYSAIQLNYKKIREYIANELEVDNVLMKFWVIKTDKRDLNLERYMWKQDEQGVMDLTTMSTIGDLDKMGIPIGREYVRGSRLIPGDVEPVDMTDDEYFDKYPKKEPQEPEEEPEEEPQETKRQVMDLLGEYVGSLYSNFSLTGLRGFLISQIKKL